jgi:NitT/TauT family transport system substrate-binding protein
MIALDYGIPTDKEGLQLRLGVERGFFRDEGIDLHVRIVYGGPEIAAAYDSGALKMGELGTPPGITAMARGANFRIVASGVRGRAVQYLVASPSVADWPGLRQRTVAALSIGSCSYWFARLVLQSHGLDPDRDLNLVGLGPRYPQILDLFRAGELQGAVISEPNVTLGESEGLFRVLQALTDAEYCPTMQWSIVVANRRFIEDEPELVRAVLRATRRSNRYCADHPDEWAAFGARHFGTDPATMARAIERERPYLNLDGDLDLESLRQAVDLQHRLGAIPAGHAAAGFVDDRFQRDAALA